MTNHPLVKICSISPKNLWRLYWYISEKFSNGTLKKPQQFTIECLLKCGDKSWGIVDLPTPLQSFSNLLGIYLTLKRRKKESLIICCKYIDWLVRNEHLTLEIYNLKNQWRIFYGKRIISCFKHLRYLFKIAHVFSKSAKKRRIVWISQKISGKQYLKRTCTIHSLGGIF